MPHFDVAIAGGGPAGAATALTLARLGRRVVLAHSHPASRLAFGEGLPPAARSLLGELDLVERFGVDAHRVSHGNVCAWGADKLASTDFIYQANGHGYQLDRRRFDTMLRTAAAQAGVIIEEARLSLVTGHPTTSAPALEVALSGDVRTLKLSCSWLVDAGGRAGALSRRLGAARLKQDRLVAFSTLLHSKNGSDRDGRTWVEAVENGWWYSALLPSGERMVAFLTDADLVDRSALRNVHGWWGALMQTRHLSCLSRAHGYEPKDAPRSADASSGRLDRFGGHRWLAVGDAALSFDPLSSQGIANALYTGLATGRAINAALNGDDMAMGRHTDHLAAIYDAYLGNQRAIYELEPRWRGSAFWQRRQHKHPADGSQLGRGQRGSRAPAVSADG